MPDLQPANHDDAMGRTGYAAQRPSTDSVMNNGRDWILSTAMS